MRLSSFSSRTEPSGNTGGDLVTRAVLDFRNTDALVRFIDATGSRATIDRGDTNLLRIVLLDPSPPLQSAELLALLREVSQGYEIRIGFNLPGNAGLAVIPVPADGVRSSVDGRAANFAVSTGCLPAITEGLALEVSW